MLCSSTTIFNVIKRTEWELDWLLWVSWSSLPWSPSNPCESDCTVLQCVWLFKHCPLNKRVCSALVWDLFILHFTDLGGALLRNYTTWWQTANSLMAGVWTHHSSVSLVMKLVRLPLWGFMCRYFFVIASGSCRKVQFGYWCPSGLSYYLPTFLSVLQYVDLYRV
jgi:hypothetical protein